MRIIRKKYFIELNLLFFIISQKNKFKKNIMKTTKISLLILLLSIFTFSVQSCKKATKDDNSDDTASQLQHSADESSYSNESENSLNDVNNTMSASSLGKGFKIAGATIDSVIGDKKFIITYNGNNSDGSRYRTGKISVQLTTGARWRDINSVITITFIDLMIKNNYTNKSITINGTHVITNVNGGLVGLLTPGGASIIHRITGNMVIAFEDATTRTWNIFRQREILITSAGIPKVKISGFGAADGIDNIVVSGTNRAGNPFSTVISQTVVFSSNSTCFNGAWIPESGVKTHKRLTKEITATFGVDITGNPVTSGCPYGYKINWTNARNESKQAVISY